MNCFRLISLGVGAAAFLDASMAAQAGPVPAETTHFIASGEGASYTNWIVPEPAVTATVSTPHTYDFSEATSSVTYYFSVLGSGPVQPIPMSINYSLLVNQIPVAGYSLNATADLEVSPDMSYTNVNKIFCNGKKCADYYQIHSAPNSFSSQGNYAFFVTPGLVTKIYILADTTVVGLGYAFAQVDPVISIDPFFLAANPGYSLALSQGIGNGVPEPASWALMLLGLGLVGGLRAKAARRLRPA
jgi:hypothetical protein